MDLEEASNDVIGQFNVKIINLKPSNQVADELFGANQFSWEIASQVTEIEFDFWIISNLRIKIRISRF